MGIFCPEFISPIINRRTKHIFFLTFLTDYSHPMSSILVGLVIKRIPVIGIVYAPAIEQLYTAIRGRGAYLNGQKLQVKQHLFPT